jgi:hypothetical protein
MAGDPQITRAELKAALLAHLDSVAARGTSYSEQDFARLEGLVSAIRPLSPLPRPLTTPERVQGRWATAFAHFGARHSAGKLERHDSNLKVQSFNLFPPVPIRVLRICQEIATAGQAYNNVIDFETPDGKASGLIIVRGRYHGSADAPQRFGVDFYRVEIAPRAQTDEAQLRASLGFGAEQPLIADRKPPKLYSDVVYLDEDMRINLGSLGGMYLLRRLLEPGVSVSID